MAGEKPEYFPRFHKLFTLLICSASAFACLSEDVLSEQARATTCGDISLDLLRFFTFLFCLGLHVLLCWMMAARSRLAAKWPLGARNSRSSPLGAAGALEMAARARSEPQWRSKWPLEPASEPLGRSECSSPPRSPWGARNGRSSPVGVAAALESRSSSLENTCLLSVSCFLFHSFYPVRMMRSATSATTKQKEATS